MKSILILLCVLACSCASRTEPGWSASGSCQPNASCSTHNVWEQTCNPWIITAPKVHLIFWGNWWVDSDQGQQANQLSQEWATLANDPNFYLPMAEYGVGAGSLEGIFYTYPNLPDTAISYDGIVQELQHEVDSKQLPEMDNQSIYVLMLPPNTQAAYDDDEKFGGYHGHVGQTTYAVIEYGSNNSMSYTVSHEIAEAATNPDTINGWWAGNGETEIADDCEGKNYSLDGYLITQLWSEQQCQCIP